MDAHDLNTPSPSHALSNALFSEGTTVVYGQHGKCIVRGIDSRVVGGESQAYYKLEVIKSALSRSRRQEPAIWVPVKSANERGLRLPLSQDQAADVLALIESREYYFSAQEPWNTVAIKLDQAIRSEGAIGLAKVASFLYVLKRKQIVPTPEVQKLQETVNKTLLRELSEALGQPIREVEDRVARLLRHKMQPDH